VTSRDAYNAFISYNHSVDKALAAALRDALHAFARPWNKLRALNVFLDEANLTADPRLWTSVAQALEESEFFVLLASPEAARSPWVEREVAHWLKHRARDRILIVETAGEIRWDEAARDFDWTATTALPAALRGVFTEEPRRVVLRDTGDLSLDDPAFRAAVVDIAAPLHRRSKDALIGRDVEEHRKRSRARRGVIAALGAFALVAAASGVFAFRQRDVAERQRDLALSRQLAQQATALLETAEGSAAPERAAALTVESWQRGRNTQASDAAARLLAMLPVRRFEIGDTGWTAAVSADGRYVATTDSSTGAMYETATGREIARVAVRILESLPIMPAISADGEVAVFAATGGRVHLVSRDGKTSSIDYRPRFQGMGAATALAMSADGRFLAIAHDDATTRMIAVATGAEVFRVEHEVGAMDQVVAVSGDGRYLALGSGTDGSFRIQVMEREPRRVVARVRIEQSGHNRLAFSPSGTLLAIAAGTKLVLLRGGSTVAERTFETAVNTLAFSADSRLLAIGSGRDLRIVETAGGREVTQLAHDGISAIAFNRGGDVAATGTGTGARIVRLADNEVVARIPHDITVTSAAFTADDRTLVTISYDGRVSVFATQSWHRVDHGDALNTMAVSPDGRYLATGGRDGTARVTEIETRREIVRATHQIVRDDPYIRRGVPAVAFSPDSRYVASGGTDGLTTVTALADGRTALRLPPNDSTPRWSVGANEMVAMLAFSPDGALLAVAKQDAALRSVVRIVGLRDGVERRRFTIDDIVSFIAFSADGQRLVIRGDDEVRLVSLRDGKEVARVRVDTTSQAWETSILSGDGRYFVVAGGEGGKRGVAYIIATDSGAEIARVRYGDRVIAAVVDPESRFVALAIGDGTARILDLATGREIERIDHTAAVTALAISRDGRQLATATLDGSVALTTFATKARLTRHVHGSIITHVAFSRDSRWLATGSFDATARALDAATGDEVSRVAHRGPIIAVDFSPDGKLLATASRDGTAMIHDVDPQATFDRLCERAGRNLTRAEWAEVFGDAATWRPTCPRWRGS
jgi:WD40 repeat protein